VRHHDNLARIEVAPEEMKNLLAKGVSQAIAKYFKELGFTYITLDLSGYHTGSMNDLLTEEDYKN
jgi:uncharacterized protein